MWLRRLRALFQPQGEWKKQEFFDERWKARIEDMQRFIQPGQSVLDIGCGKMWLKDMLPAGCRYFGCDYQDRGPGTLICDLNKKEFPAEKTDITFISGCLEYVEDVGWFLSKVAEAAPRCVIAYCIMTPESDPAKRKKNAWMNHLTELDLDAAFAKVGMERRAAGGKFMSSCVYYYEAAPLIARL
jgi:hypothetical protein